MSDIKFEVPPADGRGSGNGGPPSRFAPVAQVLRARPGEWARIGSYSTPTSAGNLALNIRRGNIRVWSPPGAFEAVSRTVDGEHRVYARFVGGEPR